MPAFDKATPFLRRHRLAASQPALSQQPLHPCDDLVLRGQAGRHPPVVRRQRTFLRVARKRFQIIRWDRGGRTETRQRREPDGNLTEPSRIPRARRPWQEARPCLDRSPFLLTLRPGETGGGKCRGTLRSPCPAAFLELPSATAGAGIVPADLGRGNVRLRRCGGRFRDGIDGSAVPRIQPSVLLH